MAGTLIKADERQKQFAMIFKGENFQNALRATLPKHMTAERLIRVVLSAMQNAPKILKCTPESIILSILRAASMGLEPDGGPLGQGYLVPFWNSKRHCNECQFIAGYRGLIKLARNSGEVADVSAEVVYEKDEFRYSLGLDPTLVHNRNDDAADPGDLKYVYAIARFRDGQKKFVVMNRREMDQIKDSSASRDKEGELVGPWVEWESEMWKKSAVRRLSKLLPLSVEIRSSLEHEESNKVALENALNFNVAETSALVPYDDPAEEDDQTVDSQSSVKPTEPEPQQSSPTTTVEPDLDEVYRQYVDDMNNAEVFDDTTEIWKAAFESGKYNWSQQQRTKGLRVMEKRQEMIRVECGKTGSKKGQKELV